MQRYLIAGLLLVCALAAVVAAPGAAAEPNINVTDPSPADDGYSSTRSPTLSVALDGPDLDGTQDYDVVFINKSANTPIETINNVNSPTTLSATWGAAQAGNNIWSVRVQNASNSLDRKDVGPFSFETPGNLTIRDETNGGTNIGFGEAVTLSAIGASYQDTRDTLSNGVLDLEGVPNKRIVADYGGGGGQYVPVRFVIRDVTNPPDIYTQDDATSTNDVTFDLRDRTSSYPEDTTHVEVRRPVDNDGDNDFRQVWGDAFGATGRVNAELTAGSRVQIVVRNGDGSTRAFGEFVADTNGELVPLDIAQISIQPPDAGGYVLDSREITTEVNGNERQAIRVIYQDDSETTQSVDVEIYERGNESNVLYGPTTLTGNDISQTVVIPTAQENVSAWVVDYTVTRGVDDSPHNGKEIVGSLSDVNFPLSGHLLSVLGLAAIVLVAGLFGGELSRIGGIVVVAIAWLLTAIGFLQIPLAFLLAAATVAILFIIGVDRGDSGGQPI